MKGGHGGKRLIIGIVAAAALLGAPRLASAATMFLSPASGQFGVGRVFAVTVRVNTQGVAVNASEGTLSFDPTVLQVVSVTTGGSIFNLNVQEPEWSNAAGTVRWAGVILDPGFTGTSGNLLTVNFRGVAPATAQVRFTSGAVLANDGRGTNVLTGMSGGTYTIGPVTNAPTPTPEPSGLTPEVTSSTHPDTALWYSNNDPVFGWELPNGVDAVSYLISPSATANPGNTSDGLVSTARFSDVPDGASYFHIKFRRSGAWGPIAHVAFNTDTLPPDAFAITRTDGDDTTNPQPRLAFVANDAVSGVARYLMRIGDGEWFEVPESSVDAPFVLPLQAPGEHLVTVEALDRAGNGTRATLTVAVASITRPVILQYPEKARSSIPFMVSGSADAGVTVRVRAFRTSGPFGRVLFSDAPAAVVDVSSDATGQWFAQIPGLPAGVYRLEANSVDGRGAVSYTSDPATVRVGYNLLWRLWDLLAGLFGGGAFWRILGWFLLLLLLVFVGHRLWHWWVAWRPAVVPIVAVGKRRDEEKLNDKLAHLWQDMTDELVLLERIEKDRPLYPEEKYLRSKLQLYRKSLRFLMTDTHSRLARKPKG